MHHTRELQPGIECLQQRTLTILYQNINVDIFSSPMKPPSANLAVEDPAAEEEDEGIVNGQIIVYFSTEIP